MCNYGNYGYAAAQPVWNSVPCNASVVGITPEVEAGKKPGLCFILVLFILLALICNVVSADDSDEDDDDICCDCDCY